MVAYDAIRIPFRQAHECAAAHHIPPIAPEHHLVYDHVCDPRPDLPVQQLMVSFKIHEDLGAYYPCGAANVVVPSETGQPDVALAEIGERVVHDELQPFIDGEIELPLQVRQVPGRGLRCVPRQIPAFLVEEHLHILEAVLLPEELLVLYPVLAVFLLGTGVELALYRKDGKEDAHKGRACSQACTECPEHWLKLATFGTIPSTSKYEFRAFLSCSTSPATPSTHSRRTHTSCTMAGKPY